MTALSITRPAEPGRFRVLRLFAGHSAAGAAAFVLDIALLWLLVEQAGWRYMPAAALAFVIAASLHYALARRFVYRGSGRGVRTGYALFLVNAAIGLAVTLGGLTLLVEWAGVPYLVARVLSSLKAGIVGFVLNAAFNFRVL